MRTLLALLMMTLAGPALAETVTRIDTELVKGRCRFIADDGEVGHYAEKRCPGLAGARVQTVAGVNRVSLQFRWGKAKPRQVVESWSIGDKLEWPRYLEAIRPWQIGRGYRIPGEFVVVAAVAPGAAIAESPRPLAPAATAGR